MSDPFIAEVIMFAGTFAPRGWAFCSGQLLPIAQNTALFSLVGTTYGGDGETTFALPDLRGRTPRGAHQSAGPGLQQVQLGQRGGAVNHTLVVGELPSHTHNYRIECNNSDGNQDGPVGHFPAANEDAALYHNSKGSNQRMAQMTTDPNGGSQAFSILNPYLGMNFIIALVGIYPSPT